MTVKHYARHCIDTPIERFLSQQARLFVGGKGDVDRSEQRQSKAEHEKESFPKNSFVF